MLTVSKGAGAPPRVKVRLFLHIFNEDHFFYGNTIDLSSWGVRFNTTYPLESGDLIKLSFVYKSPYVLNTKIVEKTSDSEYRGVFIFDDIISRISLEKNINESKNMHI